MPSRVWIDGKLYDKNDAKVSVFDHGLLFGDGVWEGMRLYAGRAFQLREHLDNLFASAAGIELTIPLTAGELAAAIEQTARANNRVEGYVRVLVTRGAGTLGLDPRKCEPMVVVIAEDIVLYPRDVYRSGLEVVTTEQPGTDPSGVLGQVGAVASKTVALRRGCLDALRFDPGAGLIGATEAAAFVVRDGTLRTGPGRLGPDPVARAFVLHLASEAGIPVVESPITRSDLAGADEVFVAGTAGELIAVVKVDDRPVGSGQEGPITRRLRELYHAAVRRPPG
jgi:branched-chain amino acid aminotransferase